MVTMTSLVSFAWANRGRFGRPAQAARVALFSPALGKGFGLRRNYNRILFDGIVNVIDVSKFFDGIVNVIDVRIFDGNERAVLAQSLDTCCKVSVCHPVTFG